MEEFRSMAQEICLRSSSPGRSQIYSCYTLNDTLADSLEQSHEKDLAAFFSSVDQGPTLRLGIIPTDDCHRPCISNDALRRLWMPEVAGFDDGALWLFQHKYDGYHHFPADGEIETFFYGSSRQAIIWAYNRRTLSTRAMIVERLPFERLPNVYPGLLAGSMHQGTQSLLLGVLEKHARHFLAPSFMGYTFAISICFLYDLYDNQYELAQIREIEAKTGFQFLGTPLREGFNIDQITKWLQTCGQVLIAYSGRKRSLGAVESLLDHLTSEKGSEHPSQCEKSLRKRANDSRVHLCKAIPHLRGRIHAYNKYMDYMTFRVERLSSVQLSTLLTHSDAQTSIQQTEASRALAEAAQQDSAAMKTIAVMTMAFLPATFIAALFAVPSLNWQSDTGNVIQGNHWVYWAFTLPATVLVFLIWYMLNRRHWIMQHIRKSARGRMDKNVQKSDIYGAGLV